ncbi:uncharacterized protein CLUP02_09316 [Colletotrichum lupini]|uniref:Uncharacterized protein n=1 Tax=Colletotrichum lupini TaxID=145971 RepID=A0A9Q8SUQ0_9PEZI|nr:uncharacterized protein CLUP02_09316 [Colletotrichum lupini]UQC83820.1 hypothetical protein CLUP02_09316 [Colletotrichum lupini]
MYHCTGLLTVTPENPAEAINYCWSTLIQALLRSDSINMMDPLTAIGLMANILAFVDFGLKGLNEAKIVYKSSSGLTEEAANL